MHRSSSVDARIHPSLESPLHGALFRGVGRDRALGSLDMKFPRLIFISSATFEARVTNEASQSRRRYSILGRRIRMKLQIHDSEIVKVAQIWQLERRDKEWSMYAAMDQFWTWGTDRDSQNSIRASENLCVFLLFFFYSLFSSLSRFWSLFHSLFSLFRLLLSWVLGKTGWSSLLSFLPPNSESSFSRPFTLQLEFD